MLQLEFSEADKHALNHERYPHPHPRVQQRMEAMWLTNHGLQRCEEPHKSGIWAMRDADRGSRSGRRPAPAISSVARTPAELLRRGHDGRVRGLAVLLERAIAGQRAQQHVEHRGEEDAE